MIISNNHHLYFAIYEYLSPFYFKGYGELGGFIGSLAPAADGTPMDSALFEDIIDLIPSQTDLNDKSGFRIMIELLKFEANLGWDGIPEFLEKENLNNLGAEIPPEHLAAWHEALKRGAEYEFDFG